MTSTSSLARSKARFDCVSLQATVWASLLALVGCTLVGCTVDESKNTAERCGIHAECSAGLVCYRDFCVPSPALPSGASSDDSPATTSVRDAASPARIRDASKPLDPQVDASSQEPTEPSDGSVRNEPGPTVIPAERADASVAVVDGATPGGPLPGCSRELLRQRADAYLTAMAADDTSSLPKHPSLRYTENGQNVQLGLGVWTGRPKVQFVRHALDDVTCSSAFYGVFSAITGRVILGARLRYVDDQLLEVEAQVVPQNFQYFNPAAVIPDGADPWVEPVPAAMRMSREAVSQIVHDYFASVSTRAVLPPSDPACRRRQDGVLMAPQGSCAVPPADRAFTELRYSLIDESTGIATAIVFFDRFVGMYLFKVSGGMIQNIDIVGGAQARSSGW